MTLNRLINKAIFSDNTDKYIDFIIQNTKNAVFVSEKEMPCLFLRENLSFTYKDVKKDFAGFLSVIKGKIVVLTDIEPLYRYDTPITRFFVNVANKETKSKIVIGKKMIRNNIYDIFSYLFFIDKSIIDINHYWCFKANHMEENIFTGKPIRMLDVDYLAKKIYKHIIIDKKVFDNDLEKAIDYLQFTNYLIFKK